MSAEIQKEPSMQVIMSELGPSVEERVAWYHHMQETQPIRYRPEYNTWEVFRYKDVQQVLFDHATFSSEKKPTKVPFILAMTDPPRHHQLRGLISQAFTPRRIEELAAYLIQMVDKLLDPATVTGTMNFVSEFAYPLPVYAIARLLGLPPEDQEHFCQWSYQLLSQVVGVQDIDNTDLFRYFSDLLDERKRDPRDDLMSILLAAEENEPHLTRKEIISLCLELMMTGNVTTTMLLGTAILRFCRQPEIYQALRADPSLIPGTIEEVLRYDFSSFHMWRMARHDTVFNGHEIKAGQYVIAWIAAANFDEKYFPHPEQFDIRRSPNPVMTFGYGIHACLGSSLARLEGRIALERFIARFSDIRLDPDKPVQYMEQLGALDVMKSLDIIFGDTPGPDRGLAAPCIPA
jgi:cytochrome P450 family 109